MKATNKDKAQKMISAKIVEKLVELANKYVVPCIIINAPGRYSASQLYYEKDALGNKLCYGFDKDKCDKIMPSDNEFCVSVNASDFTAEEMAILGYEPKFRLQISPNNIFYAISKYEQLAGIRSTDRAKFIIGEPATIYETERAKVTIYDRDKKKAVTKTKTLTIISDSLALYPLLKKDFFNYAVCALINGKWIEVHRTIYDFNVTIEKAKKIITHERLKSAVQKYIEEHTDAYADYCRLILSELDSMDKLNAEAAKTQAAGNVVAYSESNANVATENASKADTDTADSTGNDTADEPKTKQQQVNAIKETPQKSNGTTKNQCGRKSAVLSDFRGKGDKVYRQSGENQKLGVYCGKSGVSQETPRGSLRKQASTI